MVYEMAGRQVCRQAAEYKPQEVSMMLWAFAKSGNANQELFRALGRQVGRPLLSSPLLSLPQPDSNSPCGQVINKAEIFKPQELSMTVWAFATVGISAQTLFMTVEQEVGDVTLGNDSALFCDS